MMGSETTPRCYDLDGVNRFASRARIYATARPSYPQGAIDMILDGLPDPPSARLVDLGAGTGISTRLLIRSGVPAIAGDPGMDMLLEAEQVERRMLVRAEQLPFPRGSLDAVTSFNSFHWFKPPVALPEIRRVLDPRHGRLGVVWNDWDLADPFTAEFVTVMRSAATRDHPPEDREAEVAPLYDCGEFQVRRAAFANSHRLTLETLIMRLQSMTYVPVEGPFAEQLVEQMRDLHRRYSTPDGTVIHRYVTAVFVATPRRP